MDFINGFFTETELRTALLNMGAGLTEEDVSDFEKMVEVFEDHGELRLS